MHCSILIQLESGVLYFKKFSQFSVMRFSEMIFTTLWEMTETESNNINIDGYRTSDTTAAADVV